MCDDNVCAKNNQKTLLKWSKWKYIMRETNGEEKGYCEGIKASGGHK